jgi:hypothetical protein
MDTMDAKKRKEVTRVIFEALKAHESDPTLDPEEIADEVVAKPVGVDRKTALSMVRRVCNSLWGIRGPRRGELVAERKSPSHSRRPGPNS